MKIQFLFLLTVVTYAYGGTPFAEYGLPKVQQPFDESSPSEGHAHIGFIPPSHGGHDKIKPSVTKITTLVQLPAVSGEKYFPAGTKGFEKPNVDIPDLLPPSKRVEIIVKPGMEGLTYPESGKFITVQEYEKKEVSAPAGTVHLSKTGYPYPEVNYPYPPVVPAQVYGPPEVVVSKPKVYPEVGPIKINYVTPAPPAPTKKPVVHEKPVEVYGPPKPVMKVTYPEKPVVIPDFVYGPPTTPKPTPKITYPYAPAIVYGPPTTTHKPIIKITHPEPIISIKHTYPPAVPQPEPKVTYPYAPEIEYKPPTTTHKPVTYPEPIISIKHTYPPAVPQPEPKVTYPYAPAIEYGPPTTTHKPITHPEPNIAIKYVYPPALPQTTTQRPIVPAVVYGPPTVKYVEPPTTKTPIHFKPGKIVPAGASFDKVTINLPEFYTPPVKETPEVYPYPAPVTTMKPKTVYPYPPSAPYPAASYS